MSPSFTHPMLNVSYFSLNDILVSLKNSAKIGSNEALVQQIEEVLQQAHTMHKTIISLEVNRYDFHYKG